MKKAACVEVRFFDGAAARCKEQLGYPDRLVASAESDTKRMIIRSFAAVLVMLPITQSAMSKTLPLAIDAAGSKLDGALWVVSHSRNPGLCNAVFVSMLQPECV